MDEPRMEEPPNPRQEAIDCLAMSEKADAPETKALYAARAQAWAMIYAGDRIGFGTEEIERRARSLLDVLDSR